MVMLGKGVWTLISIMVANPEGLRILDLCSMTDLAVSNTFFEKKNQNKLVKFSSADYNSQID